MNNIDLIIEKKRHLLPSDFDYIKYLEYHPDLVQQGINNMPCKKGICIA